MIQPKAQDTATSQTPQNAKRLLRDVLETALLAAVLYAGLWVMIRNFRIEGSSMEPSMHHGQRILISRWNYWFHSPRRGDVIVFQSPDDPTQDLIKRVIGLPGEQVQIVRGQVFIDKTYLDEPYARPNRYDSGSWVLEEGQFFVLGDNRPNSRDSRNWGPLTVDRIIGKGWFCYWPSSLWGPVPHYTKGDDR